MNEQRRKQIFEYLFIGLVVFLPISIRITNLVLIFLCVFAILTFIQSRRVLLTVSFLPILFFFIQLISLFYTENLNEGIKSFELQITYLAIPLLFLFAGYYFDPKIKMRVLIGFFCSVLLFCLVSYLRIVFKSGKFFLSNDVEFSYYDPFSRLEFTSLNNIHPSYLSMLLLFSLAVLFESIKIRFFFKLILGVLICIFLIILASKNQLVILLIMIPILLWRGITLKPQIKWGFIICAMVTLIVFFQTNKQIQYRFKDELNTTLGERMVLWRIGLKVVNDNVFTGVGVGDRKDVLLTSLQNERLTYLYDYNNVHNQFLDYMIAFGLFGTIVYLFIIFYPLIFTSESLYYFLFIIVMISSSTESILFRHTGLFFFLIFYVLLNHDKKFLLSPFKT